MRSPTAAVVAIAALAIVLLAGCGKDDFPDRTARVTVDGRTAVYAVDSCGLDGRTVFLAARTDGGRTLQAVVGLEDDLATGVVASTGLTLDRGNESLGAFGEEAWARRQRTGTPPGEVTSARLRGSRIQAGATVVALDLAGDPIPGGAPHTVSIDARCDDTDEG